MSDMISNTHLLTSELSLRNNAEYETILLFYAILFICYFKS